MAGRLTTNKFHSTHMLTVDEVHDLDSLIDFLNSRCGSPLPLKKEKGVVGKLAKEFFDSYPHADWRALTDLATWARVKRKRLSMVQLVGSWRYAYEDGFMIILDRGSSTNDDEMLHEMLKSVEDPEVRSRMMTSTSAAVRDEIYRAYHDTFEDQTRSEVAASDKDDPLRDFGLSVGQVVKVRLSAADPQETGTVKGMSDDNRLLIYLRGETYPIDWELVYVRSNGTWESIYE